MKTKVIAKTYVRENGQVLLEIVDLGRGKYIVTRNGQVQDARRKLTRTEAMALAAEWATGISVGMRVEGGEGEDHDTGIVDSIDGETAIVRWDSHVVTPCPVKLLRRA